MEVVFQYDGIEFYSLADAKHLFLMQLTLWLPNTKTERDYMIGEYKRITQDKSRRCLLVCHKTQVALFVNRMA